MASLKGARRRYGCGKIISRSSRVSFDEMGLHDCVYIIGKARRISYAFCISDQ